MIEAIAYALFLAFMYRVRGGILEDLFGWKLGNTIERLSWAASVALVTWHAGLNFFSVEFKFNDFVITAPTWLLAGVGAYVGNLISHGAYFAMGKFAPNPKHWLGDNRTYWQCFKAMLLIGNLRGIAIGWTCGIVGMPLLLAILHPLAYSLGSTQRGEWITGAAIGLLIGLG